MQPSTGVAGAIRKPGYRVYRTYLLQQQRDDILDQSFPDDLFCVLEDSDSDSHLDSDDSFLDSTREVLGEQQPAAAAGEGWMAVIWRPVSKIYPYRTRPWTWILTALKDSTCSCCALLCVMYKIVRTEAWLTIPPLKYL